MQVWFQEVSQDHELSMLGQESRCHLSLLNQQFYCPSLFFLLHIMLHSLAIASSGSHTHYSPSFLWYLPSTDTALALFCTMSCDNHVIGLLYYCCKTFCIHNVTISCNNNLRCFFSFIFNLFVCACNPLHTL